MHNQALDDLKMIYLDRNMYFYLMNRSYNNCCVLPDTVNGISASNRNEYQVHFLGVKAAGE